MFGKNNKKKYNKNEVEKIMGIAVNIDEDSKKKDDSDEKVKNAKRSGLNTKAIMNEAKKFKRKKDKKAVKKTNTLKQNKKIRNKKLLALYIIYFIVWACMIIALLLPYFIMAQTGTEEGFEFLWLFVMIGTAIVGLITGLFIAELDGLIGGLLVGLLMGLGLYFFLKIEIGRIVSSIVLGLTAIALFFFVFRRRFQNMVKKK